MDYRCKTASISAVPRTSAGAAEPLCNSCKTMDCSNPVENNTVIILGIPRNWRLLNRGNDPSLVVACDGYTE